MRVLHIGLGSVKGGIETFAINYFYELYGKGVVFDFVDIYGAGLACRQEIEALGGKIYTLPNYKSHPFKMKRTLEKIICDNKYSCIHINIQTAANLLPLMATRKTGAKVVVHGHTSSAVGLIRKVMHWINIPRLRRADAVRLSCGKEAGKWLWGKESFEVIPNAIHIEEFRFNRAARIGLRKQYNIAPEDIVIGYVGRLESVKNPMFMLDLMEQLNSQQFDQKVVMLLAGKGSLEKSLQDKIQKEAWGINVHLLGQVSNVNELLSVFDYFVMPSIHEAFSLAAVEAQANGVCCLLSDSLPHEMKVTKLVTFLPLKQPKKWADHIIRNGFPNREKENGDGMENSIYDIRFSGEKLLKIYRTIGAEK